MKQYRNGLAYALVLLLFISTLSAQEFLLQEERDYQFAQQLADKKLHDLAAKQFLSFADLWSASPRAPEALFRAAENMESMEDYQRAADTYLRLLLRYPEAATADKALFNRGKLLAQLGDPLNAALTLERIRIFVPNSELVPLSLVSAAEQYRQAGQIQKAIVSAQTMLAQFPDSPFKARAHYLLARIFQDENQPARALQELNKIGSIRIETGFDVQATLLRGRLLSDLGRYTKSDSVLEHLIGVDLQNDSLGLAACNLVQSLYNRALFQKVIQVSDRVLERPFLQKDKNCLRLYQGDSYTAIGVYDKALSALADIPWEQSTPLTQAKLAFRRGVLQNRLGEAALALPWFSQVLTFPDTLPGMTILHRHALLQQTKVFMTLDNPGEALRHLRKHFDNLPALRDVILFQRARILQARLNDPVSARQDYALLLQFYPASALADDAALALTHCYEEEGEHKAAIKSYENYLALFPAADGATQAKDRLTWLRTYTPTASSQRDRWIAQALLAGEDLNAALSWTAERIELDHDYSSGLDILRLIQAKQTVTSVDQLTLYYLTGIAHARLSEKYRLQGENRLSALHADSLLQANRWLQDNYPDEERSRTINRLALLAQYHAIQDPLRRTAALDALITKLQDSDSLTTTLKLEQARIWCRFGIDSSSTHWLSRAQTACYDIMGSSPHPSLQLETALLQSTIFTYLQQPDSAIQVLQKALARSPVSANASDAGLQMAGMLEKSNRTTEAAALYQDYLTHYFYTSRADSIRSHLCLLYFKQQQYAQARACMNQVDDSTALQDLSPYLDNRREDDLLWLSAQAWLLQQDLPRAVSAFEEYLRTNPAGSHRGEALLSVAELYALDGNREAAIGHLEQIMVEMPEDSLATVARSRMADLFYNQQDYETAALHYAKIKESATGDVRLHAAMREVLCAFKIQIVARARQLADAFKKNFKDRKAEAQFLYEDGMVCLGNKDFKAAEILFKELSTKYKDMPEGADGEMGLARMYATLNNTEEALKILTNIPNKYSDPRIVALAYINLGEFYYENRQLENCVSAGRKALEYTVKGPENRRAIALLISVFDDLRLWDNAILLLRQYIQDYPDQEDTFNRKVQLGVFLINLKEYERGIEQLKNLLPQADGESEAEIQYWIARAYHERGDTSQAIIEFLKVKYVCRPSKLPWGTTALYEAGQAYVKLGNYLNARSLFQQIVRELGTGDQFGRVANERIREIDALLARQEG